MFSGQFPGPMAQALTFSAVGAFLSPLMRAFELLRDAFPTTEMVGCFRSSAARTKSHYPVANAPGTDSILLNIRLRCRAFGARWFIIAANMNPKNILSVAALLVLLASSV